MKLGCAIGCFTYPHYSAPYEEPLRRVAALEFDGVEMIAAEPEDLSAYYTPERVRALAKQVSESGMEVSEFILYASLVTGLAEREESVKQAALEVVRRGIGVAQGLGTDKINIVSNWPNALKTPIAYPPCYFHPNVNGVELYDPKLRMSLPEHYDASVEWDNYVDSLRRVTELCASEGMTFCLEGHANVICGSTDGFLRAADVIQDQHFCTNFDTAWQMVQREYLPWSVYKLGSRIRHVHLRDTDGMLCYTLPPGEGIIDWHGFVRALKEVNFDGYLSFEMGGMLEPEKVVRRARDYMLRVLREENVYSGRMSER